MSHHRIDRLASLRCSVCAYVGRPHIHVFGPSVKRAVCPKCGATIRTFITFVDFLLVGIVVALIVLFYMV